MPYIVRFSPTLRHVMEYLYDTHKLLSAYETSKTTRNSHQQKLPVPTGHNRPQSEYRKLAEGYDKIQSQKGFANGKEAYEFLGLLRPYVHTAYQQAVISMESQWAKALEEVTWHYLLALLQSSSTENRKPPLSLSDIVGTEKPISLLITFLQLTTPLSVLEPNRWENGHEDLLALSSHIPPYLRERFDTTRTLRELHAVPGTAIHVTDCTNFSPAVATKPVLQ